MKLWVDDLREPPDRTWRWAISSRDALVNLATADHISVMSLDHDLGGDDTSRVIVLWMCRENVWPDEVLVHSANPVGREWLEKMIARYKPKA